MLYTEAGIMSAPIDQQREYYTERWGAFEHANYLDMARIAKVLELMGRINLPPVAKICDLGCGAGWSTCILGLFGKAVGFDLSDTSRAQARFPHCQFYSGDAREWNYPAGEFDLVTSIEVIEHIDYSTQPDYIAKIRQILKPGGHLILTTPNKRTFDAMEEERKRNWTVQPVECLLNRASLRSLLVSGGFAPLELNSFILGHAHEGSHRLANSTRLKLAADALGLGQFRERWLGRAGYGLHLVALAKKK